MLPTDRQQTDILITILFTYAGREAASHCKIDILWRVCNVGPGFIDPSIYGYRRIQSRFS